MERRSDKQDWTHPHARVSLDIRSLACRSLVCCCFVARLGDCTEVGFDALAVHAVCRTAGHHLAHLQSGRHSNSREALRYVLSPALPLTFFSLCVCVCCFSFQAPIAARMVSWCTTGSRTRSSSTRRRSTRIEKRTRRKTRSRRRDFNSQPYRPAHLARVASCIARTFCVFVSSLWTLITPQTQL